MSRKIYIIIMLLLRAFYSKFGHMQDKASISTKQNIEKCLWKTDEFGEPDMSQLKIDSEVATDNDKEEFLEILRTGIVNKEMKSKYACNFRFFQNNIDEFLSKYPTYFAYLPTRIMNNCILLPIEAESQDTALRIFSTLNDRGKPLSDADIFKAQFYKHFSKLGKKEEFIAQWKKLEELCERIFHPISGTPMDELFTRYMYFVRAKMGIVSSTTEALRKFYEKNSYALLKDTVFANRKVWWKCKDCGKEWNTLISTRSGGSKCPYCSGYIFLKGFNDLQTTRPEIASEWSEKNLPLKPDEVNAKSRKNVWWRCDKCGNEWKSVINARVKGTVCPVCAEREVLDGYNDLATTDSQLLSEWDYEQNKLKPTEVSRTSAKRAWWKCRHGHSWSMKINERTILNKGCRICEQEYLSLFPALAVSYYSNKKGLKAELGSDRLLGVPLETYIPSEKLAIESGSADENIEIMKAYMCEQRGIRLIKLPMKGTELDYADSLKRAFQNVHIFISSDTEEDVEIIKNTFERWRDSQ